MTARNDVTGDALQTKVPSDNYRDGWERIFGKKKPAPPPPPPPPVERPEGEDDGHTD